jgi:hypothetical protein
MTWPLTIASQHPWVLGALNWQGQPQAQLQLPNSIPLTIHLSAMT